MKKPFTNLCTVLLISATLLAPCGNLNNAASENTELNIPTKAAFHIAIEHF